MIEDLNGLAASSASAGWNLPSWFGWSGVGVSLLAVAGLIYSAVRCWRDPGYAERLAAATALVQPRGGRGGTRATIPWAGLLFGLAAFFSAFLIARSPATPSVIPLLVGVAGVVVSAVAGGLIFSITYYNRPKWLVPPSLREEKGIEELRKEARRKRLDGN